MLGWKRLIWRDYTIRWQEVEPHLYLLSMMWTWLEANPIGLAPCLFPMWCRLFGTTLLRLLIRCFMDKTTSLYISKKKKKKNIFHRQDQNQKKVRRHPITFLSPFSIYLYDCINLFLSTKYVFMTMRKWMHALVTTLWGAQVWNYSYYYFLKENFARAWRTLGKLFQESKLDGLIYDVIFCITR